MARPEAPRGLAVEFQHVHHSFLHGDRPVRVLENFNLRHRAVGVRQHRRARPGAARRPRSPWPAASLRPAGGAVRLGGAGGASDATQDAAFLFARDALLPWRRVRSNVELGLEVRGVPKAERHACAPTRG